MPRLQVEFTTDGCLASCLNREPELLIGEQVLIVLDDKNPLWPDNLIADVVNVARTKTGRVYLFEFDEAELNGGPTFEDCDFEVKPFCCCDELDLRVTELEARIDEDTTYTFDFQSDGSTITFTATGSDGTVQTFPVADSNTSDVSSFSGVFNASMQSFDIMHSAGGMDVVVSIPLGVQAVSVNNLPDGSTQILTTDASGSPSIVGVIPADDDSNNVTILGTFVNPSTGAITTRYRHEPSNTEWETTSDTSGSASLNTGNVFTVSFPDGSTAMGVQAPTNIGPDRVFVSNGAGGGEWEPYEDNTSSITSVAGNNGETTYTHDDGAGNTVSWTTGGGEPSSVTSNANVDGTVTFTHNDGRGLFTSWTVGESNTSTIATANNGDGTITYTHNNGDGDVTVWTTSEGSTSEISSVTNPDGSETYTHDNGDGAISTWTTGGCASGVRSRTVLVTPANDVDTFDAGAALNMTATEEIVSAEVVTGDFASLNVRGTTFLSSRNYTSDTIRVVIINTCS